MKKEYKKHIVSTDKHQVWLHRTHTSNIENILRNGLSIGIDLPLTATLQPYTLEDAEGSYKNTHKGSNAVVVIKIPREIVSKYYFPQPGIKGMGHEGYLGDKEVTYWRPESSGFSIQRQHIHGWIDQETNEYHPNPYLKKSQKFTPKHFPPEYYGGLEKDLETGKFAPELAGTFTSSDPLSKPEQLKKPPKKIKIVP
ncbi:hypothetical protein KA107_01530 [Candidatus Pacearchaeota archaeon]|nr:hypothetical protein [Candidatus Pacearchaeota archaeon]